MPLPLAAFLRAAAPAAPWTPADLTVPPLVWYSAADPAGLVLETPPRTAPFTHKVAGWLDKSGNGFDVTMATDDDKPDYPAAIGGGGGLHWWGSHLLRMADPAAAAGNWAVVVVMTYVGGTRNQYLFDARLAPDRLVLSSYSSIGEGSSVFTPASGLATWNGLSDGDNLLAFDLVSPAAAELYVNGARDPAGPYSYAPQPIAGPTIALFNHFSNAGYVPPLAGTVVAEFLIIPGGFASTADRQRLEGYLAHTWGLSGKLDADHPFKTSAP